jgi:ArsR family transcriptional regulator, virulence genes transcriptional regulator
MGEDVNSNKTTSEVQFSLENITKIARFLSPLGNSTRIKILFFLIDGEVSVGVLSKQVDISQSALSQHLAILRNVGLVKTRRNAQMIFYSLGNKFAIDLLSSVEKSLN